MVAFFTAGLILATAGCSKNNDVASIADTGSDGPTTAITAVVHSVGNATSGKDVYSFETFGNEKFWTDAMRLPAGILAKSFTPVQALQAGLSVDSVAFTNATNISAQTKSDILAELQTNLSAASAPLLNNVNTTIALINANAIIGVVPKDTNGVAGIDVAGGDKVGATCALCHTITDASVFNLPNGGSIGVRLDGRAVHNLNFGAVLALADNSRAYYPVLQLNLAANGNTTLGRAPLADAITETSTEAQVDAYLSNPAYYPIGMFDDTFDGNGDPMHNSPLLRTDLAAPWGTEGAIARLDNFSNLVYTGLLDPTGITTPAGRAFLNKLGGAAGDEIVNDYVAVLAATGVTGYPFVTAVGAASAVSGTEEAPLGVRVDNQKLIDMNAYLNSLQAPSGVVADAASAERGRQKFRTTICTTCHNVDQSKPVPAFIVSMLSIFPGDNPVQLATRTPPLNPVLNTVNNIFDDKMAVVNASIRGEIRGEAMPLLLDLARKPNFLHDNSVPTLDSLLNPSRGTTAPHPFYLSDAAQRADMVEFLRGLDTTP